MCDPEYRRFIGQPVVGVSLLIEVPRDRAAKDGDIGYGICEQAVSPDSALAAVKGP
jgi:hypothetical protein